MFKEENGIIRIAIKDLLNLQPIQAYLHMLFQEFGFTAWEDILKLLKAQTGKEVRSITHRLLKDREHLILSIISTDVKEDSHYFISKNDTYLGEPLELSMEIVKDIDEISENILHVDMDMLNYPLLLRKWQNGDYFYPLGMRGKKKLSKYFKDEKVDLFAKEKQWLLCSNQEIVWVVGRRADERFKVTPATKKIIKITWHK